MPAPCRLLLARQYLADYSTKEVVTLHATQVVSAVVSLIVGFIGIVMWIRMAPSRRMLFRLRLFVALISIDFARAFFMMVTGARRLAILDQLRTTDQRPPTFCNGWGYLLSVTSIYSDMCMLTLTVQNALMIFWPRLVKRYTMNLTSYSATFTHLCECLTCRRSPFKRGFLDNTPPQQQVVYEGGLFPIRFYIVAFVVTVGAALPALTFVKGGNYMDDSFCGMPIRPVWKRIVVVYLLKYFNIIFIVSVYTSIIVYLRFSLYKIHKDKQQLNDQAEGTAGVAVTLGLDLMRLRADADAKRKQSMLWELKTFAIYPLGYVLIWTPAVIVQGWNYAVEGNKVTKPFELLVVMGVMLSMSCTFDTVVFMIREKPWQATAKQLHARQHKNMFGGKLDGELSALGCQEDQFQPEQISAERSTETPDDIDVGLGDFLNSTEPVVN